MKTALEYSMLIIARDEEAVGTKTLSNALGGNVNR